jgi:hypothetical protein
MLLQIHFGFLEAALEAILAEAIALHVLDRNNPPKAEP